MKEDSPSLEPTVAQTLKKRRTGLRLSLAQVELATKIRGKYLVKLESGDYAELPNDIYARGFVAKYANFLGLDSAAVVKQYLAERGGRIEAAPTKLIRPVPSRRLTVTPKIMIAGALLLAAGAIVAYLGWQFTALAAAPRLEISSPTGDQVIGGSLVTVAGEASPGADVFVNDSPVLTDGNGRFSDKLALQEGINTIEVVAKNKLGKTTTVSRSILAKPPKIANAPVSVPAAPFDGIAMSVTIKEAATWLTVKVDGKETRLTMLPGTSQLFRGEREIKLTTGNAGATSLVITNKVVANKSLSPLGQDGEIKRNLEFAKDTNFPEAPANR
ncbi:helix-turn-helix domain-containing protein [Candidatus Parcubacteria bacterium]|nr:helix-turn-helix domain-containing protein [Candidatus Parcubacteria bacterium]